jgi:hypothetical protein
MKRIFIVSIALAVVIAGCSSGSSEVTKIPDLTSKPEVETGGLPDYIIDADHITILTEPYYQLKYFEIGSWQEYMLDKFGIEIYLSYGMYRGKPGGFDPSSIILLNYNHIYPFSYGNDAGILDFSNPDNVYDLTLYYDKYGWGKNIDPDVLDRLTIEGGIYAVPSITDKYVIPRYYNEKILNELSMEVPTTISDFHEFLQAARQNNPSERFYPMCIHEWTALPSLSDIFRAYGVYVNSQRSLLTEYDPNTGSFEDAVFSEGFTDALGFIRSLQEERLLGIIGEAYDDNHNNHYIADITKIDKEFATEYFRIYDSSRNFFIDDPGNRPEYDYEFGYYLIHTNDKNVCELRSNMAFYMFPLSIDNIYGTIDLFNTIVTDSKYRYDLQYGMENENYKIVQNEVVPLEPTIGGFPEIRQLKTSPNEVLSLIPESLEYIANMNSELLYEKNVFNSYFTYRGSSSGSVRTSMIYELLYPFISAEDAVSRYREEFIKYGDYEKLEELNSRLGTLPQYNYTIEP